MSSSPHHADQITRILDRLADALTAVEARQDETDRAALQLVQLVGVDVQDITDTYHAQPGDTESDPAAGLAEITAWLAAYHADYPDVIAELAALVEQAAAALRGQATS